MQVSEVKELLALFDQSSLTEFDLKEASFELYLNKNTNSRGSNPSQAEPVVSTPIATPQVQPQLAAQPVVSNKVAEPAIEVEVEGTAIVSPLVGVTYLKAAPDKPNFKQVGDRVMKGEVVCIVEAMKVMNEITSDVTGEVVEILVENEQVVEFNQPLLRVKEG